MSTSILWTFEWQSGSVSFIVPDPAKEFLAGQFASAAVLPVPGCPEGSGVRCILKADAAELVCEGSARIMDGQNEILRADVCPDVKYDIRDANGKQLFRVHAEYVPQQPAPAFDRSIELTADKIYFGSAENCHVQFPMTGPANTAFEITRFNGSLQVKANRAPLGVYLNSRPLKPGFAAALRDGDFIFVSGAVFTYAGGKLLTNRSVKVLDISYTDTAEQTSHLVYPQINRTSRFHEVVPTDPIELQDPPRLPENQQRNLLVSLLPTVAMILVTILVRGKMSGGSMVLFSVFSMGIGAVGSVITYIETNKKRKKTTEDRERLYKNYIIEQHEKIKNLRAREHNILHRIYISPEQELRNVEEFTADLFDRSRNDADFLDIRLGTGSIPSGQKIRCKNHEVFEKTDGLFDLPHKLRKDFEYCDDLPVVIHGKSAGAIGVQGNIPSLAHMMNQLTLDLATRHYPLDVELYELCGVNFEPQMHAARMLPHLQNRKLGRRNIAHDNESRDLILEKLFKEFTIREEKKDYNASAPWQVIFIYTDSDIMQHPLMRYVPRAAELHTLFIFLTQHREQLPVGCKYTVRLFTNTNMGLVVNMFDREADCMFTFRGVEDREMEMVAQKLAPVYSGETSLASELVRSLSFYDMFAAGETDANGIIERWNAADTRKSLSAPLGVIAGNAPIGLDLTETAHGPHGLVAGTTGSGKSELLISYILSMACTYSPEDVNFVIIDFKGGGMATQFAGLPHLIGTITNLSDNEMMRSLASIRAESRRRQQLFNESGVSNINSYITEYRAGRVRQPLPHLIIVVDEFAELKAQQPDFMNELISTSRIGRSLGVHLILATQKPSGVVNDQIWSNSDFKLCLRVQTREDSNEVLHSPLASEIREPGRAYLQVGRSGMFQLFQSGYSGASADVDVKARKPFRLDKRNLSGRRTCLYQTAKKKSDSKEKVRTQFDAVLENIIEANKRRGYAVPRQLCLPALNEVIPFADKKADSVYDLPIGIYDQPTQQYQGITTYNILSGNLLVVGASQMGKTNLLQTILRASAERMDARDINFYIMDFNTGVFKSFADLSIVGGVVTQDQEELFKNLLKLLRQEIAARKSIIAESNVTSFKAYRESGKHMPAIVVMLDNFAAYRELYDEEYGSDITYLLREGPSAGISFCVSATRGNLLGAKNLSSFSQRILLHIPDANNMSEVIEGVRRKIPELPGRGLRMIHKELLEIQLFSSFADDNEPAQAQIARFVKEHSSGPAARAIPEVPPLLTRAHIKEMFGLTEDPMQFICGIDYASVEPLAIPLNTQFELALVGKNEAGKLIFLNTLLQHLNGPDMANRVKTHIIDHYNRDLAAYENAACVAEYTTDYNYAKDMVKLARDMARDRLEIVRNEGVAALQNMALHVIIINTREAIASISNDALAMSAFDELREQYKLMKILFIFGNLENRPVNFSSPMLLRQLKEGRQALQFEPLSTGKMYDIDALTARENRVNLTRDDCFHLDDGAVSRIKLVVS